MSQRKDYPLHKCAREGNLKVARKLIREGALVNEEDINGYTPLHFACSRGHSSIAKMLIKSGAEVNGKDKEGMTPLMLAALSGNTELLFALIDRGAKLNDKCKNHCTALHLAVTKCHVAVAKLLLEKGAAVNEKTDQGESALDLACQVFGKCEQSVALTPLQIERQNECVDLINILIKAGAEIDLKLEAPFIMTLFHKVCAKNEIDTVTKLLKVGVDIDVVDYYSKTPFHRAVFKGDLELAKFLQQNGANVNARDEGRFSALHYIGGNRRAETVRFLIECGADINAEGILHKTPLYQHCEAGDIDSVKALLEHGALANIHASGETPLHVVRGPHSGEIVEILLQKGALKDAKNGRGMTPLLLHCENGNWDAVRVLLEWGADVTKEDPQMRNPLHVVFRPGGADILQSLCSRCPPSFINKQDRKGRIPLHESCRRGKLDYVKILLASGASTNELDGEGMAPLHHACKSGNSYELLEVLLSNGANPNQKGPGRFASPEQAGAVRVLLHYGANNEETMEESTRPIHLAGVSNNLEAVKILLEAGADVDGTDGRGQTLLHIACEVGNGELIQILLNNGADVNKIDLEGKSPIHYSFYNADLLKLLISRGANVNLQDSLGNTVLHYSFKYRIPRGVLETLLEAGLDVNLKNKQGQVPLLVTCEVEEARFLLEAGAKTQDLEIDGKLVFLPYATAALLLDYGVGHKMCKCDRCNRCKSDRSVMMCYFEGPSFGYGHGYDLVRKHSVKVESAGLPNPADCPRFSTYPDEDLRLIKTKCEKEIALMKMEMVGDSCVSFFDLLQCPDQSALRHKNLPSDLNSDLRQKFPIYGDMIYSRFVPLRKSILMNNCSSFFELADLDLPRLPPECVFMILGLLNITNLVKVEKICGAHRRWVERHK